MPEPDLPKFSEDTPTQSISPNADLLARVLDDYMAALKEGRAPSHQALKDAHPGLAEELDECLAGIDFLHGKEKSVPDELGDFQILGTIGKGGMGVVYEARQRSLDRTVALKVMRPGVVNDEAMERFAREAETAAGLNHPNIVPIYAVGQQDQIHYYAMRRIEGDSLSELVQKDESKSVDPDTVAQWGLQSAQALAHAHTNGVIHRDVKPSNLILDPDDNVWLTDFGLAKRLEEAGSATMTGSILGTPRYMSPEQATYSETEIDHRTDIYSLGATLYELVTGTPVFDADTPMKLIDQIRREEPELPTRRNNMVPLDFEAILMKCLAKEPRDRYATAGDLADDLQAFRAGESISARRITSFEQSRRWVSKNANSLRWAVSAAALAVTMLLLTIWASRAFSRIDLGKLTLKSRTGPHIAYVMTSNGKLATEHPFALPTMAPLEIAEGDYRVHLSGDGNSNQHFDITVVGDHASSFAVEPIQVKEWTREAGGIATFPFQVSDTQTCVIEIADGSVTRLNADNGAVQWSQDLTDLDIDGVVLEPENQQANKPNPSNHKGIRWSWNQQSVAPWRGSKAHTHYLSPSIDIDGDGEHDLVMPGRGVPALMAVSARTGEPLWQKTYLFGQPNQIRSGSASKDSPGVMDMLRCEDADGDGQDDFITTLVHASTIQTVGYTVAINAKTGDVIWQRPIKPLAAGAIAKPLSMCWSRNIPHTSQIVESAINVVRTSTFRGFSFTTLLPLPSQIISNDDGDNLLAVHESSELVLLNTKSGDEVKRIDLGSPPIAPAKPANLVPGGFPELLVVSAGKPLTGIFSINLNQLCAFSIDDGLIWRKELNVDHEWMPVLSTTGPDWPTPVDVDGDGTDEVLVAIDHAKEIFLKNVYIQPPKTGVDLLNGKTGDSRWQQPVNIRNCDQQNNRLASTEDLNGDGIRDFVVASLHLTPDEIPSVYVDTVSGSDGKRLRFKKHELQRGRTRPDLGSPIIRSIAVRNEGGRQICSVETGDRHEGFADRFYQSYEFDLLSGEMIAEFKGRKINAPNSPNFPNSEHANLHILTPTNEPNLALGTNRYRVRDKRSEYRWRRLGFDLQAFGDVDDDGVNDLVGQNRVADASGMRLSKLELGVFSGATGRAIWLKRIPSFDPAHLIMANDLDRDGAADLILLPYSGRNVRPTVLSSRTGGSLGELRFDYSRMDHAKSLGQADVTGDGSDETFLRFRRAGFNRETTACLDLVRRNVLWEIESHFGNFERIDFEFVTNRSVAPDSVATRAYTLMQTDTKGKWNLVCLDVATGEVIWKRPSAWTLRRAETSKIQMIYLLAGAERGERVAVLEPSRVNSFTVSILDGETGEELFQTILPTPDQSDAQRYIKCIPLKKQDGGTDDLLIGFCSDDTKECKAIVVSANDSDKWRVIKEIPFKQIGRKRRIYELQLTAVERESDSSLYKNAIVFSASQGHIQCRFPDEDSDVWVRDWFFGGKLTTGVNGNILVMPRSESTVRMYSPDQGDLLWDAYLPFPYTRPWQREFPTFLKANDKTNVCLVKYDHHDYLALDGRQLLGDGDEKATPVATAIVGNLDQDDRLVHELPWTRLHGQQDSYDIVSQMFANVVVGVFALLLPLAYLVQTFRQPRFSIQWLLLAPAVLAMCLLAISFYPRRIAWTAISVTEFIAYALTGLAPIVFLATAVWSVVAKNWLRLGVVSGLALLIAIAMIVSVYWFDHYPSGSGDAYRYTFESMISLAAISAVLTGSLIMISYIVNRPLGWMLGKMMRQNERMLRKSATART